MADLFQPQIGEQQVKQHIVQTQIVRHDIEFL